MFPITSSTDGFIRPWRSSYAPPENMTGNKPAFPVTGKTVPWFVGKVRKARIVERVTAEGCTRRPNQR